MVISNDDFLEELEFAIDSYNEACSGDFGFKIDKTQGLITIQKYGDNFNEETGEVDVLESVSFRLVRIRD